MRRKGREMAEEREGAGGVDVEGPMEYATISRVNKIIGCSCTP